MLSLTIGSGDGPPAADERYQVNLWRDDEGDVCGRAFASGTRRWIDWSGIGTFSFTTGSREVHVWPKPRVPEPLVRATFTRMLQPVILQALGWQALHASAVATRTGAVTFCGRSGSGKSTLAYALDRSGCGQLADDGVVLGVEADRVSVHPLPFVPRLRPAPRDYFARAVSTSRTESQSRFMPVDAKVSVAPALKVALKAVFLLNQDSSFVGSPRIETVPAAQAFAALLSHAHCFDAASRSDTRRLVDAYVRIARSVDVFEVTYRPGLERLTELSRLLL